MARTAASTASAYFELTKPGITFFIGITAAAGYITAGSGLGRLSLLAWTIVATMLMSAGAAALNHVAERNHDALMKRTARRPIPAGLVGARGARVFGWSLSISGLATSLFFLPALTSVFLVLCHVSYVWAYTPLKRRTPLCTLTGAIPGALPVLAGWAATGQPIGVAALALTGVLFMWQIPHFLAIGWLAREDYRSAGCPMLGVVDASGRSSARVAFVYAIAMLVSAGLVGVASDAGTLYMAAALMTGAVYIGFAWSFVRRLDRLPARRLFFSSLVVLPVLLTALVADLLIG
jgi:heme o synthase